MIRASAPETRAATAVVASHHIALSSRPSCPSSSSVASLAFHAEVVSHIKGTWSMESPIRAARRILSITEYEYSSPIPRAAKSGSRTILSFLAPKSVSRMFICLLRLTSRLAKDITA